MGETRANRAIIHAQPADLEISRHIYGHFAEHLGHCIYDGFWVGPDSPVPNVRGLRVDVLEALRRLALPVLRWPGGCFADEYHWQAGIGPLSSRASIVNTHWGGVTESNHFGSHEYMDLCELLGCEPYICGNVGSGTVGEMQQWVVYLTLEGPSPMADLRRAHGRDTPWRVRYWGVGNESWGCGGNMRAEYYADQFRRYANYCRSYGDNRLYKIACGANSANYYWTEVLMREAARYMDGLSLHYYTVPGTWSAKGSATDFDERDWFVTLKKSLRMEELLEGHAAIMDRYDPQKRVGLIVDEWGTWYAVEPGTPAGFLYQQNTLRDALVAASTLNLFNRHCDRVHMANLAQTINVLQALLLTDGDSLIMTPTYHVFEMYRVHQGANLLATELNCAPYDFEGETIPGLSLSASRAGNGTIHLSVCNFDPDDETRLVCSLRDFTPRHVSGRVLTAQAMQTHNTRAAPQAVSPVAFQALQLSGDLLSIDLPAKSVVVLELS